VEQKRQITREGLAIITAELEELKTVKRPQIIAAVAEARSHGDLRENAGYEAARHDQMMLERRIQEIEDTMRSAVVVDTVAGGTIGLGSSAKIEVDGHEEAITLVGALEARPVQGKISIESPIGRAIAGHRVGDTVRAVTPRGQSTIRILEVN
jgi:transcription elongation factor GreA